MAQVKLAEHQGAEEEGTATKRYGPKGVCEMLAKTLFKGSLPQPSMFSCYHKKNMLFCFLNCKYPQHILY